MTIEILMIFELMGTVIILLTVWVFGPWLMDFIDQRRRFDHNKTGRTIDRMRE